MTRLRADILLLLVTVIWGTAFIAQKDALALMGPFTFVAGRFFLSMLVVLPLAVWERRRAPLKMAEAGWWPMAALLVSFAAACGLQQAGMAMGASIVNAGFLTGLYALFVPVICLAVFGQSLPLRVYPAALACVAGAWLLAGGKLESLTPGDGLVTLCALAFAVQIVMLGRILTRSPVPFQICTLQYAAATLAAAILAFLFESPSVGQFGDTLWPLFYAGVISGGIAYTMQGVGQRYTPSSDASVIMSAEALVAAAAGVWMRGEVMTPVMMAGGALILGAILLVELGAFVRVPGRARP